MSYERLLRRNDAARGGYENGFLAGDLRRMERDQLTDQHVNDWARACGIEPDKLRRFLEMFFTTDCVKVHDPAVGGLAAQ